MRLNLNSDFKPKGDQQKAIEELSSGITRDDKHQVLLGVTGSGKTFTMANIIANLNKPSIIFSHNKTLAAQLYGEFKQFFPHNAVEYFISYYDYYQPEAYVATTNTYIEKELSINDEIDKLRLAATSALLSGRRDVIIVASVSCIYGIGNPKDFTKHVIKLKKGQTITKHNLLSSLIESSYQRNDLEFTRGTFRVKGSTIDIYPAYADIAYRLLFYQDKIEKILVINTETSSTINEEDIISIFPATLFVTNKEFSAYNN